MRALRTRVLVICGAAVAVAVACAPFSSGSGGAVDAGTDAEAEAGSEDGGFVCPPGHFCDRFDRGTPEDSDWTRSVSDPRVVLSIDKSIDASVGTPSPSSLRVDVKDGDGGNSATTVIKHVVGSSTTATVHVRFSLRRTTASAEIQFVQLYGTADDLVFVSLAPDGLAIQEFQDASAKPGTTSDAAPVGDWVPYQLDINYAGRSAQLTSRGAPVSNISLTLPHAPPYTLRLGATALPSPSDSTVWLDDLDVWTE